MPNSLYNQLMNQNQSSLNDLLGMLKASNNPQLLLNNLAKQNPVVANVLQEVQANGGDAKSLFFKKVQQMGIDPNTILNQLK